MKTEIDYLYGDSTPSPLKADFIALLRDVFDFAVDVLLNEDRAEATTQGVAMLSEATEREIGIAEGLSAEVCHALERAAVGDGDSIAARCAARIRQGAKDLVRSETDAARSVLDLERARVAQVALTARGACARAFERLALRQDLPGAVLATKLRIDGASRYVVRLHGQTGYGLKWIVDVKVPPSHSLSAVVRVDRIAERLEVGAPEATGWIRKEVKIRPQRLDRLYLTELAIEPGRTVIKLRAAPEGSSAGFDVSFSDESTQVELVRVPPGDEGQGDEGTGSPYDVHGEDAAKLRSLRDVLVSVVAELSDHKQSLVAASLDETPLHQLETPRLLVERIFASLARAVEQISKRSLVPGEFALKRVLSESHREEVFVSKAELLKKLEPLPTALRHVFEPFGLWDAVDAPSAPKALAATTSDRAQARGPVQVSSALVHQPSAKPSVTLRPLVAEIVLDDKAADVVVNPARLSAGALGIRDRTNEGNAGADSTGQWPAVVHPLSTARAEG
jgi:hypothetical protein